MKVYANPEPVLCSPQKEWLYMDDDSPFDKQDGMV
jgi:hypothetical protein